MSLRGADIDDRGSPGELRRDCAVELLVRQTIVTVDRMSVGS